MLSPHMATLDVKGLTFREARVEVHYAVYIVKSTVGLDKWKVMSYIWSLLCRHRQYQQITEDRRPMRHIALLTYHLRRSSERHHVLGFHGGRFHHHSHRSNLQLATVSAPVINRQVVSHFTPTSCHEFPSKLKRSQAVARIADHTASQQTI